MGGRNARPQVVLGNTTHFYHDTRPCCPPPQFYPVPVPMPIALPAPAPICCAAPAPAPVLLAPAPAPTCCGGYY